MKEDDTKNRIATTKYVNSRLPKPPPPKPENGPLLGVVLDVVLDENHPIFSENNLEKKIVSPSQLPATYSGLKHGDLDNQYSFIGAIRVRLVSDDQGKTGGNVTIAYPLENGIKEYPLINELVFVYRSQKTYYYGRKINVKNYINHNANYSVEFKYGNASRILKPINEKNPNKPILSTFNFEYINANKVNGGNPESATPGAGYLGKYFHENHKIRPLKHFEGDTIIESRNGSSIRFGCFTNDELVDKGRVDASYPEDCGNPMILIRNRQKDFNESSDENYTSIQEKDGQFTKNQYDIFGYPILEDINYDGSSIQITSGKTVSNYKVITTKLMYGQEEQKDFSGDAPPFPQGDEFSGEQIVTQSDRLVFSSRGRYGAGERGKSGEMFFFSKNRFTVVTDNIFTVDSELKMALTTNSSYHLKAHDRIDVKTHKTTTWESNEDITHITLKTSTWNSKKSITHNTPDVYDIHSNKKITLGAPEIFLGAKDETNEPVLLGSTTMSWISSCIYELLWRLKYKLDAPPPQPPPKGPIEEWVHYMFKEKIMLDLMRQAPNCLSRKVFVSGNATSPGMGKMKRKPHVKPFVNIKRKKSGGDDGTSINPKKADVEVTYPYLQPYSESSNTKSATGFGGAGLQFTNKDNTATTPQLTPEDLKALPEGEADEYGESLASISEKSANARNSKGSCLAGVADAIAKQEGFSSRHAMYNATGIKNMPKYAKNAGLMLKDLGYKAIPVDSNYIPKKGDVVVYQPGNRNNNGYGHIETYIGGNKWASDHIAIRSNNPNVTIANKNGYYSKAVVYRKESAISVASNNKSNKHLSI